MKILGVIPARYASSRLPRKLLLEVNGKSILQMVYEQCRKSKSLSDVVIATDNEEIAALCKSFNAFPVMTSELHQSGTDRCAEALRFLGGGLKFDFVVNIQGDEPLMDPENIDRLCSSFGLNSEISSAHIKIKDTDTLLNPNVVKVVVGENNDALYFSRSPVPHYRGEQTEDWVKKESFYKHLGLYGFRVDVLEKVVKLPIAKLEAIEKLEQLRWLSNGYKVNMVEVFSDSIGIDTEEDFLDLKQFLTR